MRYLHGMLVWSWLRRSCLFATLAALLVAVSCVDGNVPSGTRITPEFFRYATIIEAPDDGSPGGWRAVCIKARVGQRIAPAPAAHIDTSAQCGLEFGSPIVNRQHGYIPLRMAQQISAEVANDVAYTVLSQERGVTAGTCLKLQNGMNVMFGIAIKGSTVTQCGVTNWSHGVPEVIWPPAGN